MNKEELMLVIENENGLVISNECNISTGKIILNGIEITDEESWNKAIVSVNELENQNVELQQRIDKAIEYIESNIEFCKNDSQDAYDVCRIRIASDKKLLKILRGEDSL